MKWYWVELGVVAPDDSSKVDIYRAIYQATKHSGLNWTLGEFLSIEDVDEEDL